LAILAACSNSYLDALQSVIYAGLLSSIRKTNSSLELNQKSVPYHEAVERAIVSGDTAGARDAMLTLLKDAAARLA
jgi:DNA-binding FadR family transcriptional regulator